MLAKEGKDILTYFMPLAFLYRLKALENQWNHVTWVLNFTEVIIFYWKYAIFATFINLAYNLMWKHTLWFLRLFSFAIKLCWCYTKQQFSRNKRKHVGKPESRHQKIWLWWLELLRGYFRFTKWFSWYKTSMAQDKKPTSLLIYENLFESKIDIFSEVVSMKAVTKE